jgi:hypothetical protein
MYLQARRRLTTGCFGHLSDYCELGFVREVSIHFLVHSSSQKIVSPVFSPACLGTLFVFHHLADIAMFYMSTWIKTVSFGSFR